jgi:OOP family OmpA-OmpF porin
MNKSKVWRIFSFLVAAAATGTIFGCAHYEVNTGRGNIPGYYIRSEMQESDRAVEAARQAGKDKLCPAEFKAAEDAEKHAYDVFRACHTEEGVALANQATAMANALCPPQTGMKEEEAPLVEVPAAEPAPGRSKYCISLNIEFDIDKADIRQQYHDEVGRVGDFMKKHPETTAVIEGNTDEVGSDEYNMKLSQRRAESVVNYLVNEFGIDRSRLSAKGYGKSRPIASNGTDAGKQKNRRIDAVIDCSFDVSNIAPPPERLCMALKVEFATDSAEIKPVYYDEVDKVGEYMKKYPTTTAVIEGHTDNVGSLDYNMQLSQRRAESVVNYLTEKFGIESSRLSAKGYGPTRRIAYNSTPEGREKNRRIDAVIDCVIVK